MNLAFLSRHDLVPAPSVLKNWFRSPLPRRPLGVSPTSTLDAPKLWPKTVSTKKYRGKFVYTVLFKPNTWLYSDVAFNETLEGLQQGPCPFPLVTLLNLDKGKKHSGFFLSFHLFRQKGDPSYTSWCHSKGLSPCHSHTNIFSASDTGTQAEFLPPPDPKLVTRRQAKNRLSASLWSIQDS